MYYEIIIYYISKIKKINEFGDGSDWTLSKYLTHANRTFNLLDGLDLF